MDKVGRALTSVGLPASDQEIYSGVIRYVQTAFQEDWETLHVSPDKVRSYFYFGDDLPVMVFYGRLEEVTMYDFSIVEELVNVFAVQIMGFEEALEDPDQPR